MKLAQFERVVLVEGLDREASRSYRLWENAGRAVLKEYQINPELIPKVFQEIEAAMLADPTGANRTMLGKGKDASDAVAKAYEDLKDKIYNSKPMAGFAAAYDKGAAQLKTATGGDQGLMKYIQKYRDWAEKHPYLQGAAYALLITALSLSGLGIGHLALIGVMKFADKLIQGKDIRSAAYSGAKTAAIGAATGALFHHGAPETSQQFPIDHDVTQHHPTDTPAPPAGKTIDYEIKPGETRSDIAHKFGSSVRDIIDANRPVTYTSDHNPDLDAFTNMDINGAYTGPQDYDVTKHLGAEPNPDVAKAHEIIKVPVNTGHSTYDGYTGLAQDTTNRIGAGEIPDSAISRAQQAKWDALAHRGGDAAKHAVDAATNAKTSAIDAKVDAATNAATDAASGAVDTGSNAAKAMASRSAPGADTSTANAPEYDGPPDMTDPKDVYNKELASAQRAQVRAGIDPNTPEAQEVAKASARLSMKDAIRHMEYLKSLPPGAKPWTPPNGMTYESRQQYFDPNETVRMWALKESLGRPRGGLRLTEDGVQRLFALVEIQTLNEGLWDSIKGAAGKVGAKLAQTGKNLTNKVTADKLNKAWVKGGSSNDSEVLTKMLLDMGVPQPIIDAAYAKLGIKDTSAATGDAGAMGKAGGDAGADKFIQGLIDSYLALSDKDRAEIMRELDTAIKMNDNPNLVKGMNESKRRKVAR